MSGASGSPEWLSSLSNWILALLIVGIPAYGYAKGVKIYEAFIEGAKEGFETALRIVPYLVAILAAVGAFRAAGAMDVLARLLSPVTNLLGLPPEVVPLALVRPFSGSGATGILASILNDPKLGPDSFAGRLGSMVQGSTETTFYVLSVYCGAVNVVKYRHALLVGLTADATGLVASTIVARLVWG
jgi:spore maturation protein SpmB